MKFSHLFMGFVLGAGISLVMVVLGLIPVDRLDAILVQGFVAAVGGLVVYDAEREE